MANNPRAIWGTINYMSRKVCPKCNENNISHELVIRSYGLFRGAFPYKKMRFICQTCKHVWYGKEYITA